MRVGPCRDPLGIAADARVQAHIDLIVVKIATAGEQRLRRAKCMWTKILRVRALLQTRIMLLDRVAVHRIIQKKSEIGIEVEKRSADESIHLESIAASAVFAVVDGSRARANPPAVGWINEAESIQPARRYFVQGNLPGRVKTISRAIKAESDALLRRKSVGVVSGHVVAP